MKIELDDLGRIKSLPWQLRLENAFLTCAHPALNPLVGSAAIQWQYNTWKAAKDGRYQWPHRFQLFNYLCGTSCVGIRQKLSAFGIPTQVILLQLDLWPDKRGIGLYFSFWVPQPQARMADDILRQHSEACGYSVLSGSIGSGAVYGQPWGVPAKPRSWDEAFTNFIFELGAGKTKSQPKLENEKGKAYKATPGKTTKRPAEPSKPKKRKKTPAKKKPLLKRVGKALWNA